MKNSRLVAFEILYDILKDNAYSNIAIDKALKSLETDKAFVSSLVYGVIERKITLDYILSPYLKGKTKPKVKIVLYLGVYQLYFMSKVPASAAINESVELAKEIGAGFYSSLVNAVLHNVDDNRIDINTLDDLSVKYSCPEHLIAMWKKAYGEEKTLQILSSINERPPVFAVPNHLFADTDECLYELNNAGIFGDIVDDIIMINSPFDLNNCKPFNDGLFHIEDFSSYKCAMALGAKETDVVYDVCSAPGGKAFTIAESMNNNGVLYAFDLHRHRVELIEKSAKRLGITNMVCGVNDALEYNASLCRADKILCDVPCSGFGIIRRKPEIRYKDLDSIKELPDIQYRILEVSSCYLKNGGRIIYSTCTLNKRENEKVVEKFLENHAGFKLIEENTTFPSRLGGDGFYYALMEKTND